MNSLFKNIESIEDRAYILVNNNNFTQDSVYNEMLTIENVNNYDDLDYIRKSKYYLFDTNEKSYLFNRVVKFNNFLNDNFFLTIFNHPSDTMESMGECFSIASNGAKKFLDILRVRDRYLMIDLLKWKAKALFLGFKIKDSNPAGISNESIYNFNGDLESSLHCLFNEYHERSPKSLSFLCYILSKKFNVEPIDIVNVLSPVLDSIALTNLKMNISSIGNNFENFVNLVANGTSTSSYDTLIEDNGIGIRIISDSPLFPDDELKNARSEILTLINGDILNFDYEIEDSNEISYTISDNEVAALRENYKAKLGLICVDKTKYFTCIMIEDKIPAILYHVNNDISTIHSISIYEDENNERALATYRIPDGVKYKIQL